MHAFIMEVMGRCCIVHVCHPMLKLYRAESYASHARGKGTQTYQSLPGQEDLGKSFLIGVQHNPFKGAAAR